MPECKPRPFTWMVACSPEDDNQDSDDNRQAANDDEEADENSLAKRPLPNEDSNYSRRAANDDAKSKDLAQLSMKKRTKIARQYENDAWGATDPPRSRPMACFAAAVALIALRLVQMQRIRTREAGFVGRLRQFDMSSR
ncbi:hypothetical protein BGW80DRAFT_1507390 [Lactifluus volemus]|nr:hypothetical protein BGW80DRAFT_1507390 [Lactifluus volemus]